MTNKTIMQKRTILLVLINFLLIPSVYARSGVMDFLGKGTSAFYELVNNSYFIHFITFILMFIIFYSVYAVAIKNTKLFGELDRGGKAVAISLSLMSTIGIFSYLSLGDKIVSFFQGTLDKTGLWGILGLILFLVLLNFKGFGFSTGSWDLRIIMVVAGLILLFLGSYIENNEFVWVGFVSFVVGIIFLIWRIGGGSGGGLRWPWQSSGRDGGGTDENGNETADETGDGEIETPPDFSTPLTEIQNELEAYNDWYNDHLIQTCDELLQTNAHTPPVTRDQWRRLRGDWNRINTMATQINTHIENLERNADFPRISSGDFARKHRLDHLWGYYYHRTQDSRQDFFTMMRANNPGPMP